MNQYVTGSAIRDLREKKKMTQKQLADILCVSDKTISKWETGRGLPDLVLLEPLAGALSVSVAELLSGDCISNHNRAGNLLRSHFYVCPICGNVLWSAGEGAYSCCGIKLPALECEEEESGHEIQVERMENQWYVRVDHPMTKEHYLNFLAYVTPDCVQILKLYPEQEPEGRFLIRGRGKLYACCNRHGLFCVSSPAPARRSRVEAAIN